VQAAPGGGAGAMLPQFWGISGSTSTMLSMTPPSLPGQKKAGNCFNNAHCKTNLFQIQALA
jgi:hypothetical protein